MEGEPFGKYRLLTLLGRGGMGEVWRAVDTVTERTVALKVLQAHSADDRAYRGRFLREAQAVAAITDPHVIPIHAYGDIDGRLYVDMMLVEGRDLDEVISDGPLQVDRAVAIVEQVASALTAAHTVGLTHRDVKPSNVLLDSTDFAYLIDFGIAHAADATRMTSVGSTIGTWAYMAPERFNSDDVDPRSDVYALACVLYECLTGTTPFAGERFERQYAGHMSQPPPRASEHSATVPTALDKVIAKGMAKNPDKRYRDAIDLAHAARVAIVSTAAAPIAEPSRALPLPKPSRSRMGWLVPLSVASIAVIAIAIFGFLATSSQLTIRSDPLTTPMSDEDLVEHSLQTFDSAIKKGDLATLRNVTCGETHDSYARYDDAQWTTIHARVTAARQYPVIASVDKVDVQGDRATADVTAFLAFDPATRSTRAFQLERVDGTWKICRTPQ